MGSQLIPNAVRSFFLAMVLTALLTGSVVEAASYQKTDGTIIDPIRGSGNSIHPYSGSNLGPDANLTGANLYYADLRYANLSNADLTDAILYYAILYGADLFGAELYQATLVGATLVDTDLSNANLTDANLSNADLRYSDLSNANLYAAWLSDADLSDANLSNVDLRYADLYSANLTSANLTSADLSDQDLTNANLRYTNLTDAHLTNANLTRANLHNANLTDANLYGADLTNANLFRANLTGADLYSVDLTGAHNVKIITGSPYYYGNTLLSFGFDAVAQGWTLAPYCDFTPDAACELADINQMFQAGNLVTGVAISGDTDRLDLVDNDVIDAADITEWLAQAATANGHDSPYLRGDTELDRDVDITDFNALASHFDPTEDGDPQNGPFWNEGNFDGDDDTDITDFNLLAANFSPSGYATSAIPEPSTMLLALLALILVGVSFRLSKNDDD